MYAPNSALLNALAQHKINFQQVLQFIEARYDFEPTAFTNGEQNNAASENQGSCKVFSFAQLNHFNPLDTLALFAEHYQAVRDNPDGTDHQNIRQFMHHGWAGVHFDGQALSPKPNIDEINQKAAELYAGGGSEFAETALKPDNTEPFPNQPGATPILNPSSAELVENTQNLTEPTAPKDADGSIDEKSGSNSTADSQVTNQLDEEKLEQKAEQAMAAAEAANQNVIPPAPGSSGSLATETTYYQDNDSVSEHTAAPVEPSATEPTTADSAAVDPIVDTAPPDQTGASQQDSSSSIQSQPDTEQASGQGTASASEIAEQNAEHMANNPAEFIDEQNTSSSLTSRQQEVRTTLQE